MACEPDVGIAIDVTWAKQPGTPDEYTYELGKGPTIGCGPNFHPKLQAALVETAEALEMSYPPGTGCPRWAAPTPTPSRSPARASPPG